MNVIIDGIEYEMEVAEPGCGQWHHHDERHPDGTPGQPQHHHHSDLCEDRTALLIPVAPRLLPFAEQVHDHPARYRRRVNGEHQEYEPENAVDGD